MKGCKKMKKFIAVMLILVMGITLCGCYSQEDVDRAYKRGYSEGQSESEDVIWELRDVERKLSSAYWGLDHIRDFLEEPGVLYEDDKEILYDMVSDAQYDVESALNEVSSARGY